MEICYSGETTNSDDSLNLGGMEVGERARQREREGKNLCVVLYCIRSFNYLELVMVNDSLGMNSEMRFQRSN